MLEVFRIPSDLEQNLIAFCGRQNCYHLQSLNQMKMDLSQIDLVSWGEAVLIRYFSPIWNWEISGFGIHDPGSGRAGQKRSIWDQLHPGRAFATKLSVGNTPIDLNVLSVKITEHCQRLKEFLGCP